ncbi:MAG: hypothetical protein IPH48_15225 [bacterium]|nr:hypothetical protein [bacterium]
MRNCWAVFAIVLLFASCGGNDKDSGPADDADATQSIRSDYSVGAGAETYQCTRVGVAATTWIKRFTPTLGSGVFRVWLAVDETPGAAGTAACTAALESDWRLLFVAGTGTGALTLPDDVGFKLNPGEQLVLVVHLVNDTAGSLVGNATIDLLTAGATAGFSEAEGFLAGSVSLSIPPAQTITVAAECTLAAATSIFAVMPYSNRYGTHAKVTTGVPGTIIVDESFDLSQTRITSFAPVALGAGDQVKLDFTYQNTSAATLVFGDSAVNEQCFVMTYVTPPIGMTYPYCLD